VQPTFFQTSSRIIRHTGFFNKETWLSHTRHSDVNDTAVQIWHRCDFGPHIPEALATLKGNVCRKNIHRQIACSFHTKNMGVSLEIVLFTAVSLTPLWPKSAIS
jgi:hypothetical protein